ncbi:MAG: hypothetical protein IK099_11685 [Clostridia bacterium]|nr:hypothetical protein [Clostridia bacterium]
MLDVSIGHAYKIIHKLNEELEKKGFITFAGRVPRKYLEERCYGQANSLAGISGSVLDGYQDR